MAKFVLTAQLQLQAPKNASRVINDIQKQLHGVTIPVTVQAVGQTTQQINKLATATNKASSAAEAMGRSFGLATKRFAAFTVASRAVSLFTNSLANAVDEAIEFQREVVKISQVTGKTVAELKGLRNTIDELSTGLGISSKELLGTARVLSQAGIKAGDLEVALSALAKTTLAPTFDDITETAEGAVAILAQFGEGVGALDRQLGSINEVAGKFAVESEDLIGAVRRFGGVFKASGGSLEELLAVFTAVRATTRESAESIATGLRTIFTRIQRPKTIEFLRELGVELTDVDGKFVGPFEAAKRLSDELSKLEQGDLKFIRVAEELGGFRQIGKVIPLLQQFGVAQDALTVATSGSNSLTRDAETAQQALAVQITKVKEEFLALVRSIADSSSFQLFARTALEVASALIQVADAIKPLIPLIGTIAAFKFARGLGSFAASAGAAVRGLGKNRGGQIKAFARGGFVPGSGNQDTVPAMLTPGEFVIRKSSVNKIGAGTLAAMNENKYAKGGIIALRPYDKDPVDNPKISSGDVSLNMVAAKAGFGATGGKEFAANAKAIQTASRPFSAEFRQLLKSGNIPVQAIGIAVGDKVVGESTEKEIRTKFLQAINSSGERLRQYFSSLSGEGGVTSTQLADSDLDRLGIDGVIGNAFESLLSRFGAPFDDGPADALQKATTKGSNNSAFDFPGGLGNLARGIFAQFAGIPVDAKRTLSTSNVNEVITKKYPNLLAEEYKSFKKLQGAEILDAKQSGAAGLRDNATRGATLTANELGMKFGEAKEFLGEGWETTNRKGKKTFVKKATGGGISGSDTVPAMLTPGEFVINKKAAQSIGYGNLNNMNKTGVARFQTGGGVGNISNQNPRSDNVNTTRSGFNFDIQNIYFLMAAVGAAKSAISNLGDKSAEASEKTAAWTIGLESGLDALINVGLIAAAATRAKKFAYDFSKGPAREKLVEAVPIKPPLRAELLQGTPTDKQLKKASVVADTRAGVADTRAGVGRSFFGGLGAAAVGPIGVVVAIGAVASQIASGFEEWFKRAEEQAKATDNLVGAIEANKNAILSSAIGEILSIKGLIEIATVGAKGVVQKAVDRKNISEINIASTFAASRTQRAVENIKSTGSVDDTAIAGISEAFAKAKDAATKLSGAVGKEKLDQINRDARNALQTLADAGASIGDLKLAASEFASKDTLLEASFKKMVDTIEKSRKAQEELNKANFDSLKITSAFGAAADASARLVAGLETGVDALALYSQEIESASGRLGVDATSAIENAKRQLISSTTDQETRRAITAQADIEIATNKFSVSAAQAIQGLEIRPGGAGIEDFEGRLLKSLDATGINDEGVKNKLRNIISDNISKIEGDLTAVDLSSIVQKILEDGKDLSKGFREIIKLESQHNATMTALYQKREVLEQKAAEASNQAIETQLEAAKTFEEFGGAKLTGEQQLGARIAQFNNIGGLGGLGAQLTTGNSSDIRRVAQTIGETFANQTDQVVGAASARQPGPFIGAKGFAEDKRPEAEAANKALIQFTRQRIQLLKEELSIVQKKNAAEKSALEALISGDIEGFLDKQAAAGAGAALASGSAGLTGLFSASALGAGFQTLEGQGLSDQQMRQAENLTLQRFGIQGAGVLSGTTPEEEALKSQGRELSGVLGELSQQEAAFANAEIAINNATITAAQVQYTGKLQGVQANLHSGGMVYANKGIFVPRGTDTVPAMLTPGEFVVNRAAVQRGNNLQILRAMNSHGGANSATAMSNGGQVRYYNFGGIVDGISGAFTNALPQLTNIFSNFASTVEKLVNTKFNIALDPTNININFNGGSFLATLKDDLRKEILNEVGREIQKYKSNNSGDLVKKDSVL